MSTVNKRSKITVVGSSNMDLITYLNRFPVKGETLTGHKFQTGFGGKGANQAVMASLLGSEVVMIANVGDDIFGKDMLENFKNLGVLTHHIRVVENVASGVATILVADDGSNFIAIVHGANDHILESDVEDAREDIKSSDLMVTQLEVKLEITLKALMVAKEEGIQTILNPSPAIELPQKIYDYVDILCLNEVELNQLSGCETDTMENIVSAAQNMIKSKGLKHIIVTLGDKGCVLISENEIHFEPLESPPEKVLDTTGAGDCFLGTFAHYLSNGYDFKTSMKEANLCASLSVQKEGTQTSYPRKQ